MINTFCLRCNTAIDIVIRHTQFILREHGRIRMYYNNECLYLFHGVYIKIKVTHNLNYGVSFFF